MAQATAVFVAWLGVVAALTAVDNLLFVRPRSASAELQRIVGSWDAAWLRSIAENGYGWGGSVRATPALNFLPLYPLLERGVHGATGWSWTAVALVVNLTLELGFLIVLAYILLTVLPDAPSTPGAGARTIGSGRVTGAVRRFARSRRRILVLAVAYPASLFVVQGYALSLVLLLDALAILSITRRRDTLAYLFAGIACAADPSAWALPAGYALYQWGHSRQWLFPLRPAQLVRELLGCSGMLAYMAYCQLRFHDAFAKLQAGQDWFGHLTKTQFAFNFISLRPIRSGLSAYFESPNAKSFSYTLDAVVLLALVAVTVVVWRRGGATWHVVVAAVGVIPLYIQAVDYTYTYSVTRLSYPLWVVLALHPWVRERIGARRAPFLSPLSLELAVGLVWAYLLVYGLWLN